MAKVTVVYHSAGGHTQRQAEAVLEGAGSIAGTETTLLTTKEATERLDELDGADAIIFGCPTFMGNVSAEMKAFQEAAAVKWFSRAWQDKVAGAFTNSSSFSGDKLNTQYGLMLNAMQQGMIFVSLGIAPAGGNYELMNSIEGPGPDALNRVGASIGPMSSSFQVDVPDAPPSGDLATAKEYGARVARITSQLLAGRG